jgi:hypothetical protein
LEQHLAVHAVLIPSLVAALLCVASRFIPLVRRLTPMLIPVAIAAVAVRAGVVQEGASILSTWPPATRWITALACIAATGVIGAVIGLAEAGDDDRGRLGPAVVAGVIAGAIVLLVLEIPGEETGWIIARASIAAAILSMMIGVGKVRGPGVFLSLAFPAAALAGLLLISGSAKLAVTAGAVAFACGLLGLLAIPLRMMLGAGGVATVMVAITALAAQGRAYDYDSFPGWIWLLVTLAPVTGLIADLPIVRLLPALMRFALRVVPPILLAAAALLIAAWEAGLFSSTANEDAYGY